MTTITQNSAAIKMAQPENKKSVLDASFSKRYKIFFVDDDLMIRKMLSRHFSSFTNFDTTVFSSGEECIEALVEKPDIVVLDHNLASEDGGDRILNGLDVLEKIKNQYPDIQVIMLSAQVDVQVAVDCLKKGALNYVVKDAVMQFNVEKAIEDIIRSYELKEEIHSLSNTIKRDKLLIRGYGIIILCLIFVLYYFWIN